MKSSDQRNYGFVLYAISLCYSIVVLIIFATVLALRAEIMGGVSMSTSVPGGPRAPLPRHWQLYGARTRVRRPASLTRLDEYRLGSVDGRVGIIISTPIKRLTRRDAGKVHLVIT